MCSLPLLNRPPKGRKYVHGPEEWRSSEAGAAGINPYVRETWEGLQEGTLLHYCY